MLNEKLKGTLKLYISGSQGVSPAAMTVKYGVDFNTEEELNQIYMTMINENATENIESYLEDCDYDYDEAMNECIEDSGNFYIYIETDTDTPSFIYDFGVSEIIEII